MDTVERFRQTTFSDFPQPSHGPSKTLTLSKVPIYNRLIACILLDGYPGHATYTQHQPGLFWAILEWVDSAFRRLNRVSFLRKRKLSLHPELHHSFDPQFSRPKTRDRF